MRGISFPGQDSPMLYKNPFHGFSHTWHILMGIPVPHSLGGRTMKIVLFGSHGNRVRSVVQRMPDMLTHMKKRRD